MRAVLITGSNRGLGLGLVKHLLALAKPPENVFATCRNIDNAQELKAIAEQNSNVHVLQLDVIDSTTYPAVLKTVEQKVGDRGLNVLFNNAGIASKFTRIGLVKQEQLTDSFLANTVGPIMVTKTFLPLLKKAASNFKESGELSVNRAAVINMSSILGSIANNTEGGYYPYRCSKAALNAATKSMSLDLREDGILAVCLHPGWVKTDMGGKAAPLDVNTSISGILSTLQKLTEKDTGSYMQYDGSPLPW